jgi:hypothetical protein
MFSKRGMGKLHSMETMLATGGGATSVSIVPPLPDYGRLLVIRPQSAPVHTSDERATPCEGTIMAGGWL